MSFVKVFLAEFKSAARDRQRMVFQLTMPVVVMLLVGWAFGSGRPVALSIGIVDHDNSAASRQVADGLRKLSGTRVFVGSEKREVDELKHGRRRLVVVIPAGFDAANFGFEPTVDVYKDRDLGDGEMAVAGLKGALAEATGAGGFVRQHTVTSRRMSYLDFLTPGILAVGTLNIAMLGAVATLVPYRESGLLRRIRVTPLSLPVFVASSSAVSFVLSLFQLAVIVGVAMGVFHVAITGSIPALFLAVMLGTAVFVALGIVISSLATTFAAAQVLLAAVLYPMMFLSGVFFETDGMPRFLQPLVRALPLTHLTSALRDVVAHGASLGAVSGELGLLAATGGLLFLAAVAVFRWE